MRIHIEDDIYISGNRMDYAVERKVLQNVKDKKTGVVEEKEVYSAVSYHATVEQALNGVLKLKISDSTATDLKTLIAEVEAFRTFIKENIKF